MGQDWDAGQDATAGLPGAAVRPAIALDGENVGPYRLVSPLGRGGMGEVYVATQEMPVRRSVALKLLRTRRLDARSLAHFEIERQLLAQMRHPAIAQIFDAGTTADGRPYSAMELVEGCTITDYCAQENLSLRARLHLFVRVCEGVQHAHQKGVVHRDLKPGNILVAKIDGRALPKIIDFGIASMSSGGASEDSGAVGTPAYMSPEQASSDDVDTRSDIYSLGVLLHELLCGRRPDPLTPHPHRPSEKFLKLSAADQRGISAAMDVKTRMLRRVLVQELDWVVAKATAHDRGLRYATAAELADDLLRFLDCTPMAAVPPSRAYRWGKFARRHRMGIAVACVVTLALLSGLGISLYGLAQARSQQLLAEERARQLEVVSRFQRSMLEDLDIESMGASLSAAMREQIGRRAPDNADASERVLAQLGPADLARSMIDTSLLARAEHAISRDFSQQAVLATDLLESVARVRAKLGMRVEAAETYGKVAEALERLSGAGTPAALRARLSQIQELTLAGRAHSQAAADLQQRLRPAMDALRPENPIRIRFDFDEAVIQTLDDEQAKRARLDDLLERSTRVLGAEAALTMEIANSLAIHLVRIGERRVAGEMLERLMLAHGRLYGGLHPKTREIKQNLAIVRVQTGDSAGAVALQREIVDDDARRLGSEHPTALAARGNLANMLDAGGQSEEALSLSNVLVEDNKRIMGEGHEQTIRSQLNNASFLARAGRFEEALHLQTRVIELRTRILGAAHPDTLFVVVNQAATMHQAGRTADALLRLNQMIPQVRVALGEAHPTAQMALEIRAMIARESGDVGLETESLSTLLDWRSRAEGSSDSKTVETAWRLSRALRNAGQGAPAQNVWNCYVQPLLDLTSGSRTPAQQRLVEVILDSQVAA